METEPSLPSKSAEGRHGPQHHRRIVLARRIFKSIAGLVVALIIFNIGMYVGYRKAAFTYKWSDNYYQNFIGTPHGHPVGQGMMSSSPSLSLVNGHGLLGTVVRVDQSDIVIEDKDGAEKIVDIPADASIREQGDVITLKKVKQGDMVVVLGQPETSGQVTAHLVRILPSTFGPMGADDVGTSSGAAESPAK